MAVMYPKNLNEYMPTESERDVYLALKQQLPDSFTVFYSVSWTTLKEGKLEKSESDFIVASPSYGFICLEVKGGNKIWIENNKWHLKDSFYGERILSKSPYEQAEKSMYHFRDAFNDKYHIKFPGIYAAGVVLPYFKIDENLKINHRDREITIDMLDMNNLALKIKTIFKFWSGNRYGLIFYSSNDNELFLSLIKEHIALSAAAGALIKYKERQLDIINRVQENYITFISNVKQFYIKGGAGTGKTWIAMKMADKEAQKGLRVMYLCVSPMLAKWVSSIIDNHVCVYDLDTLFACSLLHYTNLHTSNINELKLNPEFDKFDAIFVDEAQDFTSSWAMKVRLLLRSTSESRFGIFYDEVQILQSDSFGDGFGIISKPFILNENIRNTSSIYDWTAQKTKLGMDVILNPVEGPLPESQRVYEKRQLTIDLEELFKKFIDDGGIAPNAIVILSENVGHIKALYPNGIAKWQFSDSAICNKHLIRLSSVEDFKGLESDVVIYIHNENTPENLNYIAYTRAKFYLVEFLEVF